MERTSSQNWFWPEWPCSWIRAVQFSRSGQPKRGKKGDPQLRGPIKSNCVQTDLRLNILFPNICKIVVERATAAPLARPYIRPVFPIQWYQETLLIFFLIVDMERDLKRVKTIVECSSEASFFGLQDLIINFSQ